MSEAGQDRNVEVEVTLTGGLRYSTVLSAASPILRDLHVALGTSRNAEAKPFLVQLPVEGGQTACSFMSTSLVALQTTPPVLIQSEAGQAPAMQAVVTKAAKNHIEIEDFLTPGENAELLEYALVNEAGFEGSTILGGAEYHRRSKVLFAIKTSKWRGVFLNRLKLHLPYIVLALETPAFRLGDFEIQLTASNDGEYFKAHADHSTEKQYTAGRLITYVYYLHREPRPFSGGALLIYGGRPERFVYGTVRSVTSVAPCNNSLVLFTSNRWHELDMVRCPSGEFADSRFTVNGWLHSAAAA